MVSNGGVVYRREDAAGQGKPDWIDGQLKIGNLTVDAFRASCLAELGTSGIFSFFQL